MSTRARQKESTRLRILDAAYKVYSAQGFSATTLMIAMEAGISHGSVFAHFPSLADLQISIIREYSGIVGAELHRLASNNRSIRELANQHLHILSRYEDFYIRLITERSLLPQEAQTEVASMQCIVAHHFGIAIERELSKKNIKQLKPYMIFNTWIGLLHYYLENKTMFTSEGSVLARRQNELVDTFWALIQA